MKSALGQRSLIGRLYILAFAVGRLGCWQAVRQRQGQAGWGGGGWWRWRRGREAQRVGRLALLMGETPSKVSSAQELPHSLKVCGLARWCHSLQQTKAHFLNNI